MEWLRSQPAGTSLIQYPWSTSTARKWCKKGLARSLGLVMQPAPAIHSAQYMVTAKKYARDIVLAVRPVPRGAGFATASDQPMRAVARNGKQLLSARLEVAPFRRSHGRPQAVRALPLCVAHHGPPPVPYPIQAPAARRARYASSVSFPPCLLVARLLGRRPHGPCLDSHASSLAPSSRLIANKRTLQRRSTRLIGV